MSGSGASQPILPARFHPPFPNWSPIGVPGDPPARPAPADPSDGPVAEHFPYMDSKIDFAGLKLAQPLLRDIGESEYTKPTPIQRKAIAYVLQGRDLLAAAQTDTGKTARFTLPILHMLSATGRASRSGQP